MKKLFLSLALLPITLFISSQTTENPFEKLGYKPLVATLTRGEFEEFHDREDIVEIGSVLFDTKTMKIVKILNEGETTIDIPAATAAMSIDPNCEKYYWISPYAYAANNPVKYIDPDGRDYVIFYTDNKGKEQQWTFTGNNQKDAPKNGFVQDFLLSYDYNTTNGGGKSMKDAAFDRDINIGVQYEEGGGTSGFDKGKNMQMIGWDPHEGTKEDGGNGYSISPATTIDHESAHSLNEIRNPDQHRENSKRGSDPTYRTKEESRVITGPEMRTANANGEIPMGQSRGTHYGRSVRVTTPISNTADPIKTLNIMRGYQLKKVRR